jgi:DNA-binding MarR family transcriptional regulator
MRPEVPSELRSLPAYQISDAYRFLRHALDDTLREIALTTPQWGTLACLQRAEWKSGAEMARIHNLTPQTMNTILQNLDQAGLVTREPDPGNGTILRVHLTDAGRQRLSEGMKRVETIEARMLAALDPEERDLLVDLLGRCISGLKAGGISPLADPPYPDLD